MLAALRKWGTLEPEDALQDAWLAVLRRGPKNPVWYAWQSAKNARVSQFRRRATCDIEALPLAVSGFEDALIASLDARCALAALVLSPAEQRLVAALADAEWGGAYLVDGTWPQIAAQLGCSPGAAKARLARLRRRLRDVA